MKNNNQNDKKAVELLSNSAEKLTKRSPNLKILQEEIDRRLSTSSDQKSRQEILNIMFHATRNDLHKQLEGLDRLLDEILQKN